LDFHFQVPIEIRAEGSRPDLFTDADVEAEKAEKGVARLGNMMLTVERFMMAHFLRRNSPGRL
jgi:hypothetical protein